MDSLFSGFQAMSIWEYTAVVFSLAYVILAIKQSLWCWPAAFISTAIYTILFWQGALLLESALNFYYLIMAVYGWWQWIGGDLDHKKPKAIESWSWTKHRKWIASALVIALVLGYTTDNFTNAKLAYLDSFTTVFAVMTTYFVTQKILENWLYWIVVDLASVYMYWQLGYFPSVALFILYTGFATAGYVRWRRHYDTGQTTKQQSHA